MRSSSLIHLAAAAFTLAAAFGSTPAQAWVWEEDDEFREWHNETLDWAQDIAYDELGESWTHAYLSQNVDPPPREMWCVENPAPTVDDCQELTFRVRTWLRGFLGVQPGSPLPPGLPIMPEECLSICSV